MFSAQQAGNLTGEKNSSLTGPLSQGDHLLGAPVIVRRVNIQKEIGRAAEAAYLSKRNETDCKGQKQRAKASLSSAQKVPHHGQACSGIEGAQRLRLIHGISGNNSIASRPSVREKKFQEIVCHKRNVAGEIQSP